jgi:hypothetical protein
MTHVLLSTWVANCDIKDILLDLCRIRRKNTPSAFENSVTSAFALFFEKQLPAQRSETASTTILYILLITI